MTEILLVEDEESLRRVLAYQLGEAGFGIRAVSSCSAAREALATGSSGLLLTDLQLPDGSGLDLLKTPGVPPAIVITAFASVESAVEAMKLGAFDYLVKPFSKDQLLVAVHKALRVATVLEENRRLRTLVDQPPENFGIIGATGVMRELLRDTAQAAASNSTVLILGESGTGKELLARAIHRLSVRRDAPFVPISCGAVPENLLESEFFGFRKGAFTGAAFDKRGKIEEADGGTVFLDEIGDMQPALQVKILRLLQEREIQKIGETLPRKVDVRIVAATNCDLLELAREGRFREDLYYRLAVIPLRLPPLRERRADIPMLVDHFLRKAADRLGRAAPGIEAEALERLETYGWPGNVRELENCVERVLVMSRSERVATGDLPENIRTGAAGQEGGVAGFPDRLPEEGLPLEDWEREILKRALRKHDWNQVRTARYLGITRNTLQYRVNKFQLKPDKE